MYFSKDQRDLVVKAFESAETMVRAFFGTQGVDWPYSRYELCTLATLRDDEISKDAFAHLCRYCSEDYAVLGQTDRFFYRICLQDDRILDAVERGKTFIKLYPLLIYILAHELVHVVRFDRGESDFDAPPEEKDREEERVHTITHNLLKAQSKNDFGLILDCFSSAFRITAH